MRNFIEAYLADPSQAIAEAQKVSMNWAEDVDQEIIYSQIASPQFRLYEELVLAPSFEDLTFEAKNIYL